MSQNNHIMTEQNAIKVSDIQKKFKDFELTDIHLTLPQGTIMGLVGANGAGKTSLMKCILGLMFPDKGTIEVLGSTLECGGKELREHIGVVLDGFAGFHDMNAKEINLIMRYSMKTWDKERFYGYLKRFGLSDKKKTKDFSKGMRMKLFIAIALSHDSKILILDEATSGLDPIVRDEILEMLQEFVEDGEHSVLISSHILSDLEKVCDYITFMKQGRIVVSDSKDNFLENYIVVKCTEEELAKISKSDMSGMRKNAFGVEALVKRSAVPEGVVTDKASLEDIMLFMLKN